MHIIEFKLTLLLQYCFFENVSLCVKKCVYIQSQPWLLVSDVLKLRFFVRDDRVNWGVGWVWLLWSCAGIFHKAQLRLWCFACGSDAIFFKLSRHQHAVKITCVATLAQVMKSIFRIDLTSHKIRILVLQLYKLKKSFQKICCTTFFPPHPPWLPVYWKMASLVKVLPHSECSLCLYNCHFLDRFYQAVRMMRLQKSKTTKKVGRKR